MKIVQIGTTYRGLAESDETIEKQRDECIYAAGAPRSQSPVRPR